MTTRERSPWHRNDLPAWGWLALVALRVAQLLAALVPLVLLVVAAWLWTHRHDPHVHALLQRAARRGGAVLDSLGRMLR